MKELFRWIVTVSLYLWGGFCGVLLILTILVAALILPVGKYEGLIIHGCRIYLALMGIRVTTEGKEHFDPDETYIFMANHINIFDVFVLGGYIPGVKRGVEAAEHFSWPLWGWMVQRLGNIPIQRTQLSEAMKSLDTAAEAVKKGISIVILPEGHRTRDGGFQQFKKGPFHMAKSAEVPIVPMGMSGMWEIKQYKNPHWRPGTIHIRYGEQIPVESIKESGVEELRGITRDAIGGLIDYDERPRR
ncbi:MAG: 1-acyl-sn-glycerol-3-phosphate acyltransferase [Candidatus Marinimicrobia bacterium]|nr:1-acyl-sn-glycerol-3-phosphate acyltransferase [Candidatus Neomarinimicrobiota bacterium]MCF7828819.1 1-acyl-sn-glycerol-3-phosphate acyltransferase [Candidatus Neomarinimicrobiota bacterium]MCF7880736.1 1-acyl-sn-glycerol-3-phosphate acyltransferase [Candidatus Neomarinimicrobiota bacterium]